MNPIRMSFTQGYAAVSITGLLITTYLDASFYIRAKRNKTLKDLYRTTFEEKGFDKMSDFELAMYGAYQNFGGKVFLWSIWPFTLLYLAVPYLAYKTT